MSAHTPWHESIDEEADELYIVNSRGATIAEMIRGINAREEAAGIIKAVNRDHHFDALVKALEEINEIRNSIIGTHTLNWSEHVYPLVAALGDAGFEGLSYPEARANYGTLVERAVRSEDALEKIRKIVHTPTKDTRHRSADDHFQADFDSIRKIIGAALTPGSPMREGA